MNEQIKSLLVIGNGFDAKCGLKSNFKDFFETATTDMSSIKGFLDTSVDYARIFKDSLYNVLMEMNIHKLNEVLASQLKMHPITVINETVDDIGEIKKSSFGFWACYFSLKNRLPEYWYNVESMLKDFFVKKSEDIGHRPKSTSTRHKTKTQYEGMAEYIEVLLGIVNDEHNQDTVRSDLLYLSYMDKITQKLIYLLINIYGYDPRSEELSDFLLDQLKIFEQKFSDYLKQEILKTPIYEPERKRILGELSQNGEFNLLNFNYTQPEVSNLQVSRNIHSVLNNRPIFGIDSDKVHANEPYYKFTKTYRIMRLATTSEDKQLLASSIDKIAFYGHSLSEADYSYFQAIFDFYSIYSNDIKLVFYYSKFGQYTAEEVARDQFDKVSSLLEAYGNKIPNKGKNLLPKMLLENRVKILELKV
ncbi:AbiH family protein [Lactiplantibacillus plantarum]|uniref:AbiH family protein n=1 Tax=Lactiplantibacillus plantarum TaxID=1590 RepID=UPI0018AD3037|nr:AbiH family protein [Lactiplantibacillus plantarum]WGF84238.1 AbiH family protein [Lactiplantibacillus plantarum]WGG41563.1 AbiH family protein [Lactiplantibacillus plantarum]